MKPHIELWMKTLETKKNDSYKLHLNKVKLNIIRTMQKNISITFEGITSPTKLFKLLSEKMCYQHELKLASRTHLKLLLQQPNKRTRGTAPLKHINAYQYLCDSFISLIEEDITYKLLRRRSSQIYDRG